MEKLKQRIDYEFSDVEFEEKRHIYTVNGVKYPSVSSLIEKHIPKTDWVKIAGFTDSKKGLPPGTTLKEWADNAAGACDLGHITHKYAEDHDGIPRAVDPFQEAVDRFYEELPSYFIILYKELRMRHAKYKYSGTADLILLDTRTMTIVIGDFKTNKDLFKNYKNKKMLVPFDHMLDTPFSHYELQLSYYQMMIEQCDIKVTDRVLAHLKNDGTYIIYHTKDYTKELEAFKNKNK